MVNNRLSGRFWECRRYARREGWQTKSRRARHRPAGYTGDPSVNLSD
jgi:hypothetical protein